MNMNHCLELNSFGPSQTFVLEKGINSFCEIFHLFLKALTLALGQGLRNRDLSVSRCFFVLSSYFPSSSSCTLTQSAPQQDLLPHAPSLPGVNLSQGPTKPSNIWDHITPYYPSIYPFIHSLTHLINITEALARTSHYI